MKLDCQHFRRLVGAFLVFMLLAEGVVALGTSASVQCQPLGPDYLLLTKVGESGSNYCCMKPAKTPCSSDAFFNCNLAPIICNKGSKAADTCGEVDCNAMEGAYCDTEDVAITVNECTATGMQTSCTSCNPPAGKTCAQCEYATTTTSKIVTSCETGSTLCDSQPDPACS